MAKQIEGVYDKVLTCAKEEFLDKGFKEASLRVIARNAGTSTGSIYTRFGDKNGLFRAIVKPAATELKQWFWEVQDRFYRYPQEQKDLDYSFDYSQNSLEVMVDYMYDHYDEFKLIICCSEGTEFSSYIDYFVEIEVDSMVRFIDDIGSDTLSSGRATPELIHMLSSACYTGIWEVVVHDMDRQSAHTYVNRIQRFYQVGWRDLFSGGDNE